MKTQKFDLQSLEVKRLSSALGAEIRGIRLATLDAAGASAIENLLIEHKVLLFPDQALSVDEHVTFGSLFGDLEGHPHYENPITDHDKIFELIASRGGVADEWHSDITFRPNPALFSILNMVKCPDIGGDTLWPTLSSLTKNFPHPCATYAKDSLLFTTRLLMDTQMT